MKKIKTPTYGAILVALITVAAAWGDTSPAPKPADAMLGMWYAPEKGVTIEVYACDKAYCGKITALDQPDNAEGKPKVDANNPDASLRTRPIIGIDILTGFTFQGDNTWGDGHVYDPERGKTFGATLTLKDETLSVRVKVGPVHKTQEWVRPKNKAK